KRRSPGRAWFRASSLAISRSPRRSVSNTAPRSCRCRAPRRWRARAMNLFLRQFWPRACLFVFHFRFADRVFDLGLALLLRLPAADNLLPARSDFEGAFLPERERLPSTERPPASIIAA